MKNIIYVLFLALFLSSCSATLLDIPKNKIDYVKSAIICDSKTTKFAIVNQDELAEFFDSEDFVSLMVDYQYKKTKDIEIDRSVKISRWSDGKYTIEYKKYAFPMSACRKLKKDRMEFK